MRRGVAALGLTATLTLPGCARSPALPDGVPATAEARYRCEDGRAFAVRFDNRADTALLTIDGRAVTLRGRRPASGIWYSGEGFDLRGKGQAATLTEDGRGADECVAT